MHSLLERLKRFIIFAWHWEKLIIGEALSVLIILIKRRKKIRAS